MHTYIQMPVFNYQPFADALTNYYINIKLAAFEALWHRTSVKGGVHMHCVDAQIPDTSMQHYHMYITSPEMRLVHCLSTVTYARFT